MSLSIDFLPLHDAVPRGPAATLDVLLRIRPHAHALAASLPPLNLALVLDRSGSMAGEKLAWAKAAAKHAVALLGERDRLGIVSFSDEVETLAAGAGAVDHDALMQAIDGLVADGATALHGGWANGVLLLRGPAESGAVSRVLLVSDGQANRGERRPERIAALARRAGLEGISTSTLGVGRDFNEDLLEAMARAGDGEYHFVDCPARLPAIFEAELRSLTRTCGRRCSLSLTAAEGVRVVDVLDDLDRTSSGALRLPNLVEGRTLEVLVRLALTASAPSDDARALLEVAVAWEEVATGAPRQSTARFSLPVVEPAIFAALAPNAAVVEQAVLLELARVKQLAVAALDEGDWERAQSLLQGALDRLEQGPKSPERAWERERLLLLLEELGARDHVMARKRSKAQSYDRRIGRRSSGAGPEWNH